MFLPPILQQSIENCLKDFKIKELKDSSSLISACYREGGSIHRAEDLFTYLTVRMPATYAAIVTVLKNIPFPISSLLDLGAGPGTGWWAAQTLWEKIPMTLIEKEPLFIAIGTKLGAKGYTQGDLETICSYPPHDVALFGYSFGELTTFDFTKLWEQVNCIVIVEPGTPRGYQTVMAARDTLIKLGGHVLAPCPHSLSCPHPKWCHFPVRIGRTFMHRQAKQASLPFEDEKFSYVIVTKKKISQPPRVISTPLKHEGHIVLELCTPQGIQRQTFSKKQKGLYKRARKTKWGDYFLEY